MQCHAQSRASYTLSVSRRLVRCFHNIDEGKEAMCCVIRGCATSRTLCELEACDGVVVVWLSGVSRVGCVVLREIL